MTERTPTTSVVPYPDGPLIVRGDFTLCGLDGEPLAPAGRTVALCRCGRSAQKPFCDGSHKSARRSGRGPGRDDDEAATRG